MRIKECQDCGEPLDSVDHFMRCINKKGTWHGSKEGTGEWD